MKEEGEVKLLQKDNNNKNISKKKGIICNSDIEGWFEFYPKLFIKYGLFNDNFKKAFPELCSIIENPPSNWSEEYTYQGKTYKCSYYIRFMDLIQGMLSVFQSNVGYYLNEDFDKQIILCGDFISNRPFDNSHYPNAQQIQTDVQQYNNNQNQELYTPKMLNYYIIKLLSDIKNYLKINTKNDNTEKLDNHSLILIAGNHELFNCGADYELDVEKINFADAEILQPYYVTYDNNDNALIFKHAPFATEEQYKKMMANNNPPYIKEDDILIWAKLNEKKDFKTALDELKEKNIENNHIYDYNELFNTNDKTLLCQHNEELKKIENSFGTFKKYGAEKYIKQHHFYWNFFDDSKVYPIIGRNYFNTDDFKGNKNVLLIHGHTHEGQRETIPATTFCVKQQYNYGNCLQYIATCNDSLALSTVPPFVNKMTCKYEGKYIIPQDMKGISEERIKKDRRFCVDTDLYTPYMIQQLDGKQCFFSKIYPHNGYDSYVHNFIIDITAKSPKITAIDHWNANEKESKHIYEIDNIFETKTMKNVFASIGSPLCPCCSCGSLSCG